MVPLLASASGSRGRVEHPTPLNADEKELLGAEFTLHGEPGFVWSLGERGTVWARFAEGFRQLDASEVRAAVAKYLLDC